MRSERREEIFKRVSEMNLPEVHWSTGKGRVVASGWFDTTPFPLMPSVDSIALVTVLKGEGDTLQAIVTASGAQATSVTAAATHPHAGVTAVVADFIRKNRQEG